jgi:hypothetical protein
MATVATPYGLRAVQAIGGRPFSGGTIREYKVSANNAAAIFNGDLVVLSSAGQPAAVGTSPVGNLLAATSVPATAGIVGVCVGARYVNAEGQPTENQFLPANLVTGGATEVFVKVMDDPAALFQIKGTAALGTFNSGTAGSGFPGAIGKNAVLGFATAGLTSTGNSGVNLIVGSNGAGLVTTANLAVRIVDIVKGTESEAYPEFIVKLNVGVHSYDNALGV